MYCPKCLNNTLALASHGIVNITINGKQMDTGRFLYNADKESKQEIIDNLTDKLIDFFKWYSTFKNQDPIKFVQISSSDFVCEDKCAIDLRTKFSVIDILIPKSTVNKILHDLGQQYNMKIELQVD
ncbi:MAG: hypothetical protein A2504_00855 [Bdellovibrionales bacterium RIFOXYD12_FULL_39_22]|nr:MAG: hypothetical protein A2385_03475 [Bdellovibrionales bacterium RIFOXYB1_FULL_39_21]OFZ42612.1 MAG: hypothetical protein A2485_09830 [Bdellovibrionales bacterium RIFOXYC12_FULL_39_17]OFZ47120.1 MAG: hypothetical protein A2404_15465 [Bdellovibrionales bacterium RIFOXYC1_FULL_39_130]OFZ75368.1 MAG: hypothetical protein A2560_14240 [Bdellovibrionales bacterium RIFOXYD1_FULL_39_84]OFZ93319.1 MAG: hypothetical protein A2504_00855 [Bdellovibrionales bacterium RIFOXYD12_FULL_39_22]HLE10005.1 hy